MGLGLAKPKPKPKPNPNPNQDLAEDGLDIDGNAWGSEPASTVPAGSTDTAVPSRRRRTARPLKPTSSAPKPGEESRGGAASETGAGLRNVQLNHVVGYETDYLALSRLPVRRADVALIIADAVQPPGLAASSWSQPQMNDSGAMTSSILLRRLRDEVTAGLEGAERPPPLQVVTQPAATYLLTKVVLTYLLTHLLTYSLTCLPAAGGHAARRRADVPAAAQDARPAQHARVDRLELRGDARLPPQLHGDHHGLG